MASRRSPDSPLECSFPLSAQIPLQSFVFPIFPPQASRLRELTLVCDIKLDDYQEILSKNSLEEQREKQLAPNTHARRSSYNASKSLVFHAPNLPPSNAAPRASVSATKKASIILLSIALTTSRLAMPVASAVIIQVQARIAAVKQAVAHASNR